MRRIRFLVLLAATGLTAACGQDPAAPFPDGLEGLWNLPHQETPGLYGFNSAQMIFRADGAFEFHGTSMFSAMSDGTWRRDGQWTLEDTVLTLVAAQDTVVLDVRMADGEAHLTDRANEREYRIFRPLPD